MIKRLRRRILGGTAWCWEPACDLLEPAEDCLSGWEEASRWARWLYESGEAIDAVPLGGRGPPYVRSKAVGTSGALESADGGRSIVYKAKKTPSSCCRRDEACDPFHAVGGEKAARERARSTWRSEPARASSGGVARMRLHTGAFGLLKLGELLDGGREQNHANKVLCM